MPYCSAQDIRNLTDLSTTDISDAKLGILIDYATAEVNECISVLISREKVEYIDETRENNIDGSNTTFYINNWKGRYLCDMGNDGDVSTDDVEVFQVASNGTETSLTVSSVTPSKGEYVLSSAPASSVELYTTYTYSVVPVDPPHTLVKKATIYLAAAIAYTKIDATKVNRFSMGKFSRTIGTKSYDTYYKLYRDTLNLINKEMFSVVNTEYAL